MKGILIFSGTTEGRKLAEVLAAANIPAVVCVATEYGRQMMPQLSGITLHQGRMDADEMGRLMEQEAFSAVVDATHPFAEEVSENIRKSASGKGIPYLRLQRDTKKWKEGLRAETAGEACFSGHGECAAALERTTGNIFLTTGSKELAVYCEKKELAERIYVRVLPSEESIGLCRKAGISGNRIFAMQGPFSTELNAALMRQYNIRYLVTKESGDTGGFAEKLAAAEQTGASVCIIGNPEKTEGLSFREVCERLEGITGCPLCRLKMQISLLGIGMGDKGTWTVEAKEKAEKADYLFGAKRLLQAARVWTKGKAEAREYPYYRAEDMIPILEEIGLLQKEKAGEAETVEVAVLFSGDSGFYSGCRKLCRQLEEWKKGRKEQIGIRIYPGISSVSYFAAACGISWQDGKIISIHGKESREEWEAELLQAVRYGKKVFLLVSGAKDVRAVGKVLEAADLTDGRILLGYQLSYQEECIRELTAEECGKIEEEGLYLMAVLRESCEKKCLAPGEKDGAFLRGNIPMTKEEVREITVCKMKLTEEAVVYDIGSGTGSVAVEMAECSGSIRVYALERKEEGAVLIRQNRKKFRVPNLKVIQGSAPEAFADLPVPTHAFIGGSGGRLRDILTALYQKNPAMRIVITAVSLETVSEIAEVLKQMPVREAEMIQIQVSRAREAGSHHLMQAENPVFICSFDFMPQ